ncbi:hypothetical protein [Paraburkholderia sp. SIMBA_030]
MKTAPDLAPGFVKHEAGFSHEREARFFFAAVLMVVLPGRDA